VDRDVAPLRVETPLDGDEQLGAGAARDPETACPGASTSESRPPARVVVVDDHPAVRGGVVRIVDEFDGLTVAGTAATATEGRSTIERERPQVALLDYHLPDEDGLRLCLDLKGLPAAPGVVVYSAFADASLAVLALIAGADRLAAKSAGADELCRALCLAARGGPGCHLPLAPHALSAFGERLDPRDVPILGMLAHGVPAGEIAEVLGVSPRWLAARRWAMLQRLQEEAGADRLRRLGAEPAREAARRMRSAGGGAAA
jgi:DNA-binding NarL/FixJ family response regulator